MAKSLRTNVGSLNIPVIRGLRTFASTVYLSPFLSGETPIQPASARVDVSFVLNALHEDPRQSSLSLLSSLF